MLEVDIGAARRSCSSSRSSPAGCRLTLRGWKCTGISLRRRRRTRLRRIRKLVAAKRGLWRLRIRKEPTNCLQASKWRLVGSGGSPIRTGLSRFIREFLRQMAEISGYPTRKGAGSGNRWLSGVFGACPGTGNFWDRNRVNLDSQQGICPPTQGYLPSLAPRQLEIRAAACFTQTIISSTVGDPSKCIGRPTLIAATTRPEKSVTGAPTEITP